MKAAICKEFKKPLVIEDIPIPEIGPDEVLIKGRLSVVGAAQEPIYVNPFDLITKRIVITGSAIGGRKLLREMLEFSAFNNIKPIIQEYKFEDVNKALDDLRSGKIVLRGVLKFN